MRVTWSCLSVLAITASSFASAIRQFRVDVYPPDEDHAEIRLCLSVNECKFACTQFFDGEEGTIAKLDAENCLNQDDYEPAVIFPKIGSTTIPGVLFGESSGGPIKCINGGKDKVDGHSYYNCPAHGESTTTTATTKITATEAATITDTASTTTKESDTITTTITTTAEHKTTTTTTIEPATTSKSTTTTITTTSKTTTTTTKTTATAINPTSTTTSATSTKKTTTTTTTTKPTTTSTTSTRKTTTTTKPTTTSTKKTTTTKKTITTTKPTMTTTKKLTTTTTKKTTTTTKRTTSTKPNSTPTATPASSCTSGYSGKKNGNGPKNACCLTESDCKQDCVKGKCT
ncbi:uncharacterized protein B0P05DRAFT_571733 [Gilbertella persicaria]|uniref:Uncharacterized protein n=1 Tax=Rhizopus stolonifer TaxID=4846 RepID=A0A367KHX4_RHIST|nr:uncharacterized protein B0P05DRAFT_571733 [Gilbertella persicaria]KAI8079069.1 hypothetical protein B0P05DRAFT_571733 [Gilbertella persicaria]RCI01741.1 hypothetical protein CU098_011692 [Rhizopus stolonifer]